MYRAKDRDKTWREMAGMRDILHPCLDEWTSKGVDTLSEQIASAAGTQDDLCSPLIGGC